MRKSLTLLSALGIAGATSLGACTGPDALVGVNAGTDVSTGGTGGGNAAGDGSGVTSGTGGSGVAPSNGGSDANPSGGTGVAGSVGSASSPSSAGTGGSGAVVSTSPNAQSFTSYLTYFRPNPTRCESESATRIAEDLGVSRGDSERFARGIRSARERQRAFRRTS